MTRRKPPGGAQSKKDTIDAVNFQSKFGFAKAFMYSDPELKHLFQQAIKQTWTPDLFVAHLRNTKWFKTHSADVRNAIVQKASDPATYKANVHKMYVTVSDTWGKTFGAGTGNQKDQTKWAELAYRMGWSEQELIDHMGASINYEKMLHNSRLGGTAGETQAQLDSLVDSYGLSLGDKWKAARMKEIIEGGGTVGGVQDQVREMAKQQYGAFANAIDSGKTVADVADPYVTKMADLLEVNPNSIGLHDATIQKALTMKDQHGKPAAMNINDFANSVRRDPRWQYTANAKQSMANATTGLLQQFGLMAQ